MAGSKEQVFQIEIRYDFKGTLEEAKADAHKSAGFLEGGQVSAIFDENWEEVEL